MSALERDHQGKIKDLETVIKDLESSMKDLRKNLKDFQKRSLDKEGETTKLSKQIFEMKSVIDAKDKSMQLQDKEREKSMTELRGFKDRCKVLELELEQTRGFENSSILASAIGGGSANAKRNDYEIKQIKDLYEKKLNKANEDLAKKVTHLRTMEQDCERLREENKQFQQKAVSLSSQRFDKDQEVITELEKARSEINRLRQVELDVRMCFNMKENQDMMQQLTKASQDLEMVPLLEKELEKLRSKLEDLQRQLIEKDQLNSTMGSSNQLRS